MALFMTSLRQNATCWTAYDADSLTENAALSPPQGVLFD